MELNLWNKKYFCSRMKALSLVLYNGKEKNMAGIQYQILRARSLSLIDSSGKAGSGLNEPDGPINAHIS